MEPTGPRQVAALREAVDESVAAIEPWLGFLGDAAMAQLQDKTSATPTSTPAAPATSGGTPAATPAAVREKVARSNYKDGAALLQPDNAPGYNGGKDAVAPAGKEGPNRYAMTGGVSAGDGKYGNWRGTGVGLGTTEKDEGKDGKGPKNARISAPKVADVGPSKEILKEGEKKELGGGKYVQKWAGTSAENEVKPSISRDKEGVTGELASGNATASAGVKLGVGAKTKTEGKYGSAEAKADAGLVAQAGARAKYGIGSDGVEGSFDASAKAGAEASASAEATSAKFLGTDAGAAAKAKGFVGARAGAGAKVAVTKDFVGAKGNIGGFAGAEASGEVEAHVGPVTGKVKGSVQAGIGASLDGEISYDHGKLKFSARAAVALGIGASLGTSVEIDLGQALKMGGEIAKIAYRFADQDGDGKLTLNDGATLAGKGVKGGAKAVDKGVDGAIAALDADGDGKFTSHDLAVRAQQAGNAVKGAGKQVVGAGKAAIKAGHDALDRDGDGKLGLSDVTAGAKQLGGKLVAAEHKVADKAKGAAKWAVKEGAELKDAAGRGLKKAGDLASGAVHKLHDAADADGDGKLSLHDAALHAEHAKDAVVGAGKKVVGAGVDAAKWAGAKVSGGAAKATRALHDAADVNGDGKLDVEDAKAAMHGVVTAVQDKAHQAKQAVRGAMDVNGDGKIDAADISAAAAAAKERAVAAYHGSVDKAKEVAHKAVETAKATAATVKKAADRDGDGKLGLNDVVEGGKQAYRGVKKGVGVVAEKGKEILAEAKRQAGQARATFSAAVDDASATLSGSWGKIKGFFGGKPKPKA